MNLWTFCHSFEVDLKDKLLGYRFNKMKEEFEAFLTKLIDNGAQLIFIFKKNQSFESDFSTRVENEYLRAIEILDVTETLKSFQGVVGHFERNSEFKHPPNLLILLVMMQSARKFGEIIGMDSTESRQSTAHVKIANEKNAMAILGHDSYYSFYEGSWKFWSDHFLDMKSMTVREYNKGAILKALGLSREQIPLFVILAGGLYSTPGNIKAISKHFKFWEPNYLERITSMVRQQRFPMDDTQISTIIKTIFNRVDPGVVADFKRSLSLLDVEDDLKYPDGIDREVMQATENEFLNYANEILQNKPIFISPSFIDLR
jgi:hypothetical protein